MSILLFGQKADRTHENHMLRAFIQALKADWQHTDKDLILIANSMWNGAEIDLVCILPSAVLLIDFKDYKGRLTAAENGPWIIDGIEVKGGSKENPFQQLRDNKFSIMSWFRNNNLLKDRNVSHTNAAVIFTGPAVGKPNLSGSASRWFHTTDFSSCSALLADLASPELTIYRNDIDGIISALGVRKIACDYGQANRDTTKPSKLSVAELPEPDSSSDSQEKPVVVARPLDSDKPAANTSPEQKRLVSGMFKSVAVVGGIFLTMAVVSQIYPSSGQSSTIAVEQPQKQIEQLESRVQVAPREQVFTSVQEEPAIVPVIARNTVVASSTVHIEARSASNYIGEDVTACGTVAEYTRFKKGVYLNFDKAYPQQTLTLVIWDEMLSSVESNLGRLGDLTNVDICVSGQVEQYKQRMQIQITDASAVQLKSSYAKPAASNSIKANADFERIEAYRAPFYVGKQVMACGVLAGTSKFAKGMYLNLDKKYPNQTLTLVVWNDSVTPIEAKFGSLNSKIGHTLCALGTIEKYKKHLQIQIENPQFLRLMQQ